MVGSGTVVNALHQLSHLILQPYVTDEAAKKQRDE